MTNRSNNFKTRTLIMGVVASLGIVASPAQAIQIFFGEDLNSSATVPLPSFPNASSAESDFLSNLVGTGTEDFEGFADGTDTPLNLTFPGSTGNITATLSGGGGQIESIPAGQTNGGGRYGTSPNNFFEVEAGGANNFEVEFNTPIAALGFFGVDIGDFGGQLTLELSNGTTQMFTVPNTVGSGGSTDGSVIFYGLIADNSSETFTTVSFLTTTGDNDVFAFDDFTVADIEQVNPNPIPEPPSIIAFLILGSLGLAMKYKEQKLIV